MVQYDILEMPTCKNVMSNNVYNLNQVNSENVYDYVNLEYCTWESMKVKSKKKFSWLHINISSTKRNLENWRNFLWVLECCPDIIAIAEARSRNPMNFSFHL